MTLLRGYLAPRGGWTEAHAGLSADHGGRNQLGLRSASRVCEILRDEPLRHIGAEDAIVIAGEGPAAHRGGCYHMPRAMVFRGRLAGDEESPRGGHRYRLRQIALAAPMATSQEAHNLLQDKRMLILKLQQIFFPMDWTP